MTWEETILFIQGNEDFNQLVRDSYIESDLKRNVVRYGNSEEFGEIRKILKDLFGDKRLEIADIGSGNGISAVNLALLGHRVRAVEPDESETVGAKAIDFLKKEYSLTNLSVLKEYGEEISIEGESIDLYFSRQAMHHASDLNGFVSEASRLLKRNGYFLTVRDHAIYDEHDKKQFLKSHPLHRFYGGENAFTLQEYIKAIADAGLTLIKIIKHFDSPINYAPILKDELTDLPRKVEKKHFDYLSKKYPLISKLPGAFFLYKLKSGFNKKNVLDEKFIPGRMYSFLAQKK